MKINSIKKYLIVLIALTTICSNSFAQNTLDTAGSPKKSFELNMEVNYMRHYLWRGALFGADNVSQPSIKLSYKKFSVGLAINANLQPNKLPKEYYTKNVMYDEQDFEIGYSNTYKKLDIEAKVMAYIYFHQIGSPSTAEAYLKLSYPVYKNLSCFTETAYDLAAYNGGIYNNTGLLWEKSLNKTDIGLSAYTSFGNTKFMNAYYSVEKPMQFLIGSKLDITQNFKRFYIKLSGEVNPYISQNVIDETERKVTSNYVFSVGKTLHF